MNKGWVWNGASHCWENHDYSYPISVEFETNSGLFYATLWIEHPGVHYLKNGDPGYPPEWDDLDLGSFKQLDQAKEQAEAAAAEQEEKDAKMYAEWEAMLAKHGGYND